MAPKRKGGSHATKKKALDEASLITENEVSPSEPKTLDEAVASDDKPTKGKVEKTKNAKAVAPPEVSISKDEAATEEEEKLRTGDKRMKGSNVVKKKGSNISKRKQAGGAEDEKPRREAKGDKAEIDGEEEGSLAEENAEAEKVTKGKDKSTATSKKTKVGKNRDTAAAKPVVNEHEDVEKEVNVDDEPLPKRSKVEQKTKKTASIKPAALKKGNSEDNADKVEGAKGDLMEDAKAKNEIVVKEMQAPQKVESDKRKDGKPPASRMNKKVVNADEEAEKHNQESEENDIREPVQKKKRGRKPKVFSASKEKEIPDGATEEAKERGEESDEHDKVELPDKKKRGRKPNTSPASKKKAVADNQVSEENDKREPDQKKKRGRKPKVFSASKEKENADGATEEAKEHDEEFEGEKPPVGRNVIIIEASKECHSFKTRAAKVQEDLTNAVPGIEVFVNPEKPRKGCFEIRNKEGVVYVSLLDMLRPFTKLKNLDLTKTVEDIVARIK